MQTVIVGGRIRRQWASPISIVTPVRALTKEFLLYNDFIIKCLKKQMVSNVSTKTPTQLLDLDV